MPTDLILGTAGHIDHGKTALVKALTGVDTDRLPEEKRRGITIDLGFAQLPLGDYRLGIVDVPGHERLVRNMLAGATGMDLALLVIAADDSIKPQTREHLEILRLLGLASGVIALTKADLVDPEWLALVTDEVRQFVAGTFLAEAPIVATSARTGQGLDALRAALSAAAQVALAARTRSAAGPFRMAIDRAFTVAGHGTVVTGSVASGHVSVGEELEIQPLGIPVRVRGLQSHDHPVEQVAVGQRAALNLVGVRHDELGRGQELATPGHLRPARVLSVRLQLVSGAGRPLADRARVRLHLGTAEVMASVRLLEGSRLAPGESMLVQLFLAHPVAATWRQPLIVRSESPVETIGGGVVLLAQSLTVRRAQTAAVEAIGRLDSDDPAVRIGAAIELLGLRGWQPADLPRLTGVAQPEPVLESLLARGELRSLPVSPSEQAMVHRRAIEELAERTERALEKLHAAAPRNPWVPLATVRQRLAYLVAGHLAEPRLIDAALARLVSDQRLLAGPRGVALPSHQVRLVPADQQAYDALLASLRREGLQPATPAQWSAELKRSPASVIELLRLAVDRQEAVELASDFFLSAEHYQQVFQVLRPALSAKAGLTVSEIRDLLGTSRKYAVPLCEHLDRIGFTRRQGDLRALAAGTAAGAVQPADGSRGGQTGLAGGAKT